ncbi:hypothetical protein GCM10010358_74660 [Streptomyces minutiscleroticus]|uniref:Uncharacterized protein n=1 Tax=Streptomyces minutiscleroticus TaxID=68238 RepID=A0A918P101_9ACTN|nr:hypothetical protein GCM10010358_74660 [Streptomyces minutiscleroticus]
MCVVVTTSCPWVGAVAEYGPPAGRGGAGAGRRLPVRVSASGRGPARHGRRSRMEPAGPVSSPGPAGGGGVGKSGGGGIGGAFAVLSRGRSGPADRAAGARGR